MSGSACYWIMLQTSKPTCRSFGGRSNKDFNRLGPILGSPTFSLRVQVPNNYILTPNLYYNSYYPKPKSSIIGYVDALRFGKLPFH